MSHYTKRKPVTLVDLYGRAGLIMISGRHYGNRVQKMLIEAAVSDNIREIIHGYEGQPVYPPITEIIVNGQVKRLQVGLDRVTIDPMIIKQIEIF